MSDPFEGLRPGRIVYFIFNEQAADEVNRRRTTGVSIAERMRAIVHEAPGEQPIFGWPQGAQAHIGNAVYPGDLYPAVVLKHHGNGAVNLKVFLDGSDDYWAVSVPYDPEKKSGTWAWMFEGQATRYMPDRVEKYPTPTPPPDAEAKTMKG
jgi:hypothetical protein